MQVPGNPAPVTAIQAIRYARHERTAQANFAAPVDDHDLPMPLDYYVWAIHRDGHPPVIVDTGFGATAAAARGREITRPIRKGLRDAGIDRLGVEDVILTHLHYDHAGNLNLFPHFQYSAVQRHRIRNPDFYENETWPSV